MQFGASKTEQGVMASATGRRFSWLAKGVSIALGMVLAGVAAYAATNWIVGLSSNSSGEAQSATISNVTIRAVASPAVGTLLSPGGTGDVVVTISNANPYPVTITGVQLPTSTTYATGYTTNALTTTQAGCVASSPSDVTWSFATTTSGSSHALDDRADRCRQRQGQQPTDRDADRRRLHGAVRTPRVRQHVLLHAVVDRYHRDRWRERDRHLEPHNRQLDELTGLRPGAGRRTYEGEGQT